MCKLYLGIDPGLNNTGLGFVSFKNGKLKYEHHELIKPPSKAPLTERLAFLASGVVETINKYDINSAAIEDIFYSVNVKSALLLGQTRGAIIASLTINNLQVYEYTALQIKQSVVGYGKAAKEQVKKMVEIQLNRVFNKVPLDVTDALACAICLALNKRGKSTNDI